MDKILLCLMVSAAALARTCVVTPAVDFRDSLASLDGGDTLFLSSGTYTAADTLPLLHVEPDQAGLTITTVPEAPAVLDGEGFQRPVVLLEGEAALPTRLELVEITGGSASSGQWFAGGGVFMSEAGAIIFGCTFQGNQAVVGGAIAAEAGSVEIQRCMFQNNSAESTGGAINLYACDGLLLDCRIRNNSCTDDGGGINSYQSDLEIRNLLLAGNQAGDDGGGMMLLQGTHTIEYVTVDANQCVDDGAGMLLSYLDQATLSSCVVTSNTGKYGIAGKGSPDVDFHSCCVWDNGIGNYIGWEDPTGTQGNISADPLYADTLYHLSQTAAGQPQQSPCVDAGHQAVIGSWIQGYSTRTDSIPDSLVADMGYHHPDSLQVGSGGGPEPPGSLALFPSPCSDWLCIQAPAPSPNVSVAVFDAAGRRVWQREGVSTEGWWSGVWTPRDDMAPGLVLVRFRSGDTVLTGKAVLLP